MNAITQAHELLEYRFDLKGLKGFKANVPAGALLTSVNFHENRIHSKEEVILFYLLPIKPGSLGQPSEVVSHDFELVPMSPRPVYRELGLGGFPFPVGTVIKANGDSFMVLRLS
jgi:hypothetical protein